MDYLYKKGAGIFSVCLDYFSKEIRNSKSIESIYSNVLNSDRIDITIDDKIDISDKKGYLIISNHISVLDFPVIKSLIPCKVITSATIVCDTIEENIEKYDSIPFNFMNPDSGKVVRKKIVELTSKNENVLLFPEGLIHCLSKPEKFYRGGIETAYLNNISVIVIKLNFLDNEGNLDTINHNIYSDIPVFLLGLPIEKIKMKVETLCIVEPNNFDSFDFFYDFIYESF